MPKGPFGGPRITELLPFSSDEAEVEFKEERNSARTLPQELEGLLGALGEHPEQVTKVRREVIVKQEPDEGPVDILNSIKKELSELGKRAATIQYYVVNGKIGYIHSSKVDKRFRRKGLATELRGEALDDMEKLGVQTVYSFPTTDAGLGLVKSQGFTESEVVDYYSKEF